MKQTEAQYLNDLDKRLWPATDMLRSNLDAAVYTHVALTMVRDTLLPKLLSGEPRVKEAEKIVEAAL